MNSLEESVRDNLAKGKSKEEIYLDLLQKGHTVDEINRTVQKQTTKSQSSFQNIAIRAVAFFGAISVGLGVLSFIAANWAVITQSQQILILCCGIFVAYAGAWFANQKDYTLLYEPLLILGNCIYGAAVFLVGRMGGLEMGWNTGFFLWAIGIGVAYLIVRSAWTLAMAGVILLIGLGGVGQALSQLLPFSQQYQILAITLLVLLPLLSGIQYILWRQDKTLINQSMQ